jgi:hypothetical protein
MRRSIQVVLVLAACLAVPAAAAAATPFSAGSGAEPTVAVGSDGSGHVVWETTDDNAMVGYCRVSPGGSACDRTELLGFGASTKANSAGRARVFAPAPDKVVITAGCWNCPSGIQDRTYRWISTNNGASFGPPVEIDAVLGTNGFGAWLDDVGLFVAAVGARAKAEAAPAPGEGVQYASGSLFVYGPEVARVPGTTKLVAATNDLEEVKYGVFVGAALSAPQINDPTKWQIDKTLSGAEGDNSDTSLGAGPNGVTLTYLEGESSPNRIGLRRFDAASNSFGGPLYLSGEDPIDASPQEPDNFQDAAGRIHVAWGSLYDGGRLRYRVSDSAGDNFSATANLATSETFNEPELAAAADGRGFVTWTPGTTGAIRVVALDPQPEPPAPVTPPKAPVTPKGPGTPDTTKPGVTGFGIDTAALLPGQAAKFTFNASEAGLAVLTFEERFLGLKGKRKGKNVCLPRTKKRLAALRKTAETPSAYRQLLKKRSCRAYKRIGEIRQSVRGGRNTIEFDGRIAGRKLKPGSYRANLVVTDGAGLVSRTETVNFKVVKPKPKAKAKPRR